MKPDVRIFADVKSLSLRAAEAAVRTINESVQTNGSFSLVLSGGNTPRTLYSLLSSQFRDQIPWTRVHVFWGDERYVPLDDLRKKLLHNLMKLNDSYGSSRSPRLSGPELLAKSFIFSKAHPRPTIWST